MNNLVSGRLELLVKIKVTDVAVSAVSGTVRLYSSSLVSHYGNERCGDSRLCYDLGFGTRCCLLLNVSVKFLIKDTVTMILAS